MSSMCNENDALQWIAETLGNKSPLRRAARIGVVGLSDNKERPSYRVAQAMQRMGFSIVPINPVVHTVLGEPSWATLSQVPAPIDVVQIFRRSEHVPALGAEILQEMKRLGVRIVWLQEGVQHAATTQRLREMGLYVVENRCLWKDLKRYVT